MASPSDLLVADDEIPGEGWWLAYGDPQLNDLIAAALDAAPAKARPLVAANLVSAYGEFWRLAADRDTAEARARNRAKAVELAALDAKLGAARQRLAALVGAGAGQELTLRTPSAGRAAFELPAGRIEQLVSRRPDLLAARWRAADAERRVEIARTEAGSRPTLFAFLDRHALSLSHLVRSGSDLGQARLAFRVAAFDGDGVGARIEAAEAAREASGGAYTRAHLAALRDVAAAVASERALDRQLSAARAGLAEREAACQAVRDRYAAGRVNQSALLAAEEAVIRRRGLVAGLLARGMIADATLVAALGGGVSAAPAK